MAAATEEEEGWRNRLEEIGEFWREGKKKKETNEQNDGIEVKGKLPDGGAGAGPPLFATYPLLAGTFHVHRLVQLRKIPFHSYPTPITYMYKSGERVHDRQQIKTAAETANYIDNTRNR